MCGIQTEAFLGVASVSIGQFYQTAIYYLKCRPGKTDKRLKGYQARQKENDTARVCHGHLA